jgi:uncharacterized SAM-binding protein YcdF (DUF218 family)
VLLVLAGVLCAVAWWVLSIVGAWVSLPPHPARADVIVVSGGASNRTQHAVELFEQGMASELWHTGWSDAESTLSNREKLATMLPAAYRDRDHPVPEEAIHLLATSTTWEDGQTVAALAQERGIERILVVTDWHHSRRAVCVLRHHLKGSEITVLYDAALREPENLHGAWWLRNTSTRRLVWQELQKLAYYMVRYGLPLWEC